MLIYISAAIDSVDRTDVKPRVGRRLSVPPLIASTILKFSICSAGIGGSVLSIMTQFLLNRSQHFMVDECRNKFVNILPRLPPGSVLGPKLNLLYTSDHFSILKNKLTGYPDIPNPCPRQG